jgi:subtilase family serine protease
MTPAQTAHIVYVGAPNNYQHLDAALNHVVDRHLANIVTNSYGWSGEALPAGFINPVYNIMVEAAATGVGLYFSSGDDGDETFGDPTATPTPDWPASSPLVTAVGGTSLEWNGTTRTEYGWESAKASLHTDGSALSWGTPAYQYGGGGISRLFARPWYQDAAVASSGVSSVANSSGRVVPGRRTPTSRRPRPGSRSCGSTTPTRWTARTGCWPRSGPSGTKA